MEKKTMGAFIATMRKAKGMTQLQLAERLGVSNKTISHWECDESAPDLSLLPELADILGITCDELLRGELNTIESTLNAAVPDRAEDAKDEEKKIKKEKSHLNTSFIISVGLEALAWLAVLLVPNLESFPLPYFVGGVLLIASFVVSLIALNKASNNVSVYESQAANDFKHYISKIRFVAISMFIAGILFCYIYQYLNLVVTGAYILINIPIYFFATKKKDYSKKRTFKQEVKINKKLFIKCVSITLGIVILLGVGQIVLNTVKVKPDEVFDNFSDFKDYMAEDVILYPNNHEGVYPFEDYYPQSTNFYEEPLYTWTTNRDDVSYISWGWEGDNYLPIEVYRIPTEKKFENMKIYANIAITVAYIVVLLTGTIVYFKKHKKADCEE